MKKKIILSLFVFLSLFMITGCGKDGNSSEKHSLGDTVKTDIVSFKLVTGKFTYALVNTNGDEFATPKEYNAEQDNKNPYVAAKGHTLASFTFYLENLDRSSIDIGGSFNSKFGSIKYGKDSYGDTNDSKVVFKASSEDNLNWKSYSSGNILLQAGEKGYYRAYIDIPTDVENLDDTMELTIYLPTSKDKTESFTFVVSKEDRETYKEEISEEAAIKNLNKKIVQEYFNNKLTNYSSITGDEIKTSIEGKKFNVTTIDGGTWQGTFTFETSGKIYEGGNKYATGYVNQRTWNISGNILNLSWVNGKGETKTESYEVKKVKDGVYLLVTDNKVTGILY